MALFVRSVAISRSINHSSNFVGSFPLKMAMSYSSKFMRFVCFCVVHNVSVYWGITSPKGSKGEGVEVGCALSMRERFCSSHSMQTNPSIGWPSLTSTHCHKLLISLVSAVNFTWLLCRRLQPSASDHPKAIVVPELFVLSLSLLVPISIHPVSSTWELSSMSLPVCPVPLWQVVIAWVLYVAQNDWCLSLSFPRTVLSGECTQLLLLLWCPVLCRVFLCK